MSGSSLSFLVLASILIVAVIGGSGYYSWRLRRSARSEWGQLLKRLIEIDREGVDTVALDAIEPSGERRVDDLARELEPERIWELLGGLEGVERLETNSRVLIEMAAYLQRSYDQAAAVAEELRLQARELEWHVERLRLAAQQGSLEFHIGTYAQNAAIAYYLMERQLQTFCQRMNLPAFRTLPGTR